MSAAKGIAGGFPLGATLAKEFVAKHLVPGTHGSTFGGNPLACAVARMALRVLTEEGMIENAATMGDRLKAGLASIASPLIQQNTVNIFTSDPDFARFRDDLIRMLSRFPDAYEAVLAEFDRIERSSPLASDMPALEHHAEEAA